MIFRVIAVLLALTLGASAQVGQIPRYSPVVTGGGGATVALVDTGTAAQSGGSVTTFSGTGLITVSSSISNGCLICAVYWNNQAITSPTVTWNGVSMTQVSGATALPGSGCSPNCAEFTWWSLPNPASGAQNLTVNWATTSTRAMVNCWSFSGVNQTTPTQNGTNTTSATNSTAGTLTISSATGDMPVAGFASGDGVATLTTVTPGGETQLYLTNTLGATSNGANEKPGAASVTLTATFSTGTHWGAAGFDLVHQ